MQQHDIGAHYDSDRRNKLSPNQVPPAAEEVRRITIVTGQYDLEAGSSREEMFALSHTCSRVFDDGCRINERCSVESALSMLLHQLLLNSASSTPSGSFPKAGRLAWLAAQRR